MRETLTISLPDKMKKEIDQLTKKMELPEAI